MTPEEKQYRNFKYKNRQLRPYQGLKWHQVYGVMKLQNGDRILKVLKFNNRKERQLAIKNLIEETVNYPERENLFVTISITKEHD